MRIGSYRQFAVVAIGSRIGTTEWQGNLGSTWGKPHEHIISEHDTREQAQRVLDKINTICGTTSLKHKIVEVERVIELFN